MFRVFPKIDIEDFLKMTDIEFKQPIIFKVKIEDPFLFDSRSNQISYLLIAKPGLAHPPHTNDDIRLARDLKKSLYSRDRIRQCPFMEIIDEA